LGDFVGYDLGIADPTVFFALSISLFYTCFYLTMAFVLTTIVRIKAHMFWKTTFVYYCYRFIKDHCSNWPLHRLFRYIKENWEVGGKTVQHAAWLIGILTALEFIGLLLFDQTGVILFIWIFYRLLTIPFMLVLVLQWKKISQGIHCLVSGDIEHAIDTTGMYFDFKQDAENLNQVGDTVRRAVNQQMKSERLKTELITNVSHDIKTPLTSIINYVDLLQKEMNHIENPESRERQQEYLEVLSRQSNRLKKLIQDLIDASKATTGNIEVDIKPMVIDVILNQAIGEFEDRLHACNLELCVDEKVKEKTILADGRHLWRVFDNLLGNIVKYSLPGTRVYVDVDAVHFASGNRIGITFRNISKEKLNIAPEELMERFKRGDSSRNTEGSGLGLSIANSLVQLMDGEMQIHIDGDLFKVQLLLKKLLVILPLYYHKGSPLTWLKLKKK
jgi:signal transduction histidine kinase